MPELSWLGDRDARRAAGRVPYRLLQPVAEIGDPAAENLLIQGDNLQALKSLLPSPACRAGRDSEDHSRLESVEL